MPQGSSVLPECFVKVINELMKGLEQVAAYLDDVIVSTPAGQCGRASSACGSITSSSPLEGQPGEHGC